MSTLPLLSHHVLSCRIVYWATAVVSLPYLRRSVHCYASTRRNAQMIAVRLLLVLILRHGSGGTAEFGDGSVSALSMLFGTILTLISPLRVRSRKCLLLALFLICSTASLLNLPRTISHRNSSSAPRKRMDHPSNDRKLPGRARAATASLSSRQHSPRPAHHESASQLHQGRNPQAAVY